MPAEEGTEAGGQDDVVHRAILAVLQGEHDGLTMEQLQDAVQEQLREDAVDGDLDEAVLEARLQLEMRGLVRRVPSSVPARLMRVR